jgi:dTDP-4-amino-4,6-dideoxygalactose transaminase
VHLFGQMCDMDPIMEIAGEYGFHVIEDAAQSITATYKGRKAGSIGTVGCFSFFPSKNLGGVGDGGMIVTNDEALYAKIALFRNHGAKPKYHHRLIGGNFRLDPIQAAVLLVKLPHLADWSRARRCHAAYYDERFRGTGIQIPCVRPENVSIYNQYVIRVPNRDGMAARLKANNIGCEIYYPLALHLQVCFASLGYAEGSLPEAERATREVLALPIFPELSPAAQCLVANAVLNFNE